jgi:membrane protease YdiL (CAAX protease family)
MFIVWGVIVRTMPFTGKIPKSIFWVLRELPFASSWKRNNQMTGKKLQIFEIFLVLSVAFLPSIILSLVTLFSGSPVYNPSHNWLSTYLTWLSDALLSIILMFYVLHRQGKDYSSIGLSLSFSGTDLLHAFGILFISRLFTGLLMMPVNSVFPDFIRQASNPANLEFVHTNYIFFITLIVIINPLKEELIVRGFTMSQIFYISNSKYLAVIVSVAIQFSYHLYQGLPSALLLLPYFIISALYFVRYGNLNPVIIAHLFTDAAYVLSKK